MDGAFERGRTERHDLADDQLALVFKRLAFEAQAESAGAYRRWGDLVDARVRAVQLADQEIDVATQLGAGACAGDVGLPFIAERLPVVMVEVSAEEAVIECVPGLVEDDLLLVVEVDLDRRCDGNRARRARVEGNGANAGRCVGASVGGVAHAWGLRGSRSSSSPVTRRCRTWSRAWRSAGAAMRGSRESSSSE